ncbi:hypothetical protein TNCV_2744091 [Trichonephila clavipes]|nr:hypothetical protein TNCV_2744091 [Trichonephila clavipes]
MPVMTRYLDHWDTTALTKHLVAISVPMTHEKSRLPTCHSHMYIHCYKNLRPRNNYGIITKLGIKVHDEYLILNKGKAEVDILLRRHQRRNEQLSEFEKGRNIRMMGAGWLTRQVAISVGRSDLTVKNSGQKRSHLHGDQIWGRLDKPVVEQTFTSYDKCT